VIQLRVGFSQYGGIIGRLVRWQTRSPWSHAALLYQVHADPWRVIEAHYPAGVVDRPHSVTDDFLICSVEHPDMQEAEEQILAFAQRQVGKAYDLRMVARFITRQQEARETSGRWFCSELVYAAFWYAGVELLGNTQPWEVSPGLLRRSPYLQFTTGDYTGQP
jgi:uncharacterized protein YycO